MMCYGHFYAHGRLNDLQRSQVKDETPSRYTHTKIQTQVVVICEYKAKRR